MEHLAIMKKSWNFIEKIILEKKKVESRWYKSKRIPWDKIKSGETIYFKDSGSQVCAKAKISKVLQFSGLTVPGARGILKKYGKGICIERISDFLETLKNKKYCILIFLKNPEKIKPFDINKKGFGLMSAWIVADSIKALKKN